MKKILLLIAISLACMSNSKCDNGFSFENDECTYLVLDKGSEVGSHFNMFHKDGFEVSTDYFVTFKNTKTGHVFVHKFREGKDYYMFQKGKTYKCRRFHEDNKY